MSGGVSLVSGVHLCDADPAPSPRTQTVTLPECS